MKKRRFFKTLIALVTVPFAATARQKQTESQHASWEVTNGATDWQWVELSTRQEDEYCRRIIEKRRSQPCRPAAEVYAELGIE